LSNLANDLFIRFEQRGINKDLNEAITLRKQGLDVLPVGHPGRSNTLNNLGNELSSRFTHQSNENDINEVITLYREVLALYPVGHPHRSESLNNLASALSTCFQQQGNEEQLDEAITFHREALDLWPVTHPSRSASLNNSLQMRSPTAFGSEAMIKTLIRPPCFIGKHLICTHLVIHIGLIVEMVRPRHKGRLSAIVPSMFSLIFSLVSS
jgi:5-methylcytosine-specific restriction endonuclease McrA